MRALMTKVAAGPDVLGIDVDVDGQVDDGAWTACRWQAARGLDGPPGILQGGLAAGVTASIARLIDRFDAPLTGFDARLHAPTPLGTELTARSRPSEGAARYAVETWSGAALLVSAEVELAGHDPAPAVADLAELARVPLPPAEPQWEYPTCFVCGPAPTHPHGLHHYPRWQSSTSVVVPWVADEGFAHDGVIDPLLVSAVLDCPSVWAAIAHVRERGHVGALLAGFNLRVFHDAPIMEPLRIVARMDSMDGRKIRSRAALVDEDGLVYALASAFHVSVAEVPSFG
ncbi:MAG: hypothetical protein WD638_07970 [Nitriliruptoraceae bacterium]